MMTPAVLLTRRCKLNCLYGSKLRRKPADVGAPAGRELRYRLVSQPSTSCTTDPMGGTPERGSEQGLRKRQSGRPVATLRRLIRRAA